MSVTMYAILGFAMMLILTAVLVSGKFTPSIPMIVIPPFLMIYKRLNMRPLVLMCLVSITAGVMNCLPWGGPCGRLAAGFNISATDIMVAELPGMIIGLIGAIIPLVLLFVMYKKVIEYVLTKFSMLSSVVQFMSVTQVFEVLTPVALILGMGIGLFGSVITIRKHLRV